MRPGDRHYRAWVGPPQNYDIVGAQQFNLLTNCLGLREGHTVLDIGCGSLRLGRFLIVYLEANKYFGIEPEEWVVQEGLKENLGTDLVKKKNPRFVYNPNFNFDFGSQRFDYIIAQSVFSHTSLAQIRMCLGSVKESLEPNGVFVFNVGYGKQDYEGDEWVYPGCVTYRPATIDAEVDEIGMVSKRFIFPLTAKSQWTLMSFDMETIDKKTANMAKVVS